MCEDVWYRHLRYRETSGGEIQSSQVKTGAAVVVGTWQNHADETRACWLFTPTAGLTIGLANTPSTQRGLHVGSCSWLVGVYSIRLPSGYVLGTYFQHIRRCAPRTDAKCDLAGSGRRSSHRSGIEGT